MKSLLTCAATLTLLCGASLANAKTINLYSEAKEGSKVTGTLNTEAGVTIVYSPKNSEWIKVANPANGDVGWVKSSDLGGNGYSVQFVTTGNGPHGYSFYQFGSSANQPSRQQIEMEMKQFERQQRIMQQHMQNMFNDMFTMFSSPIFVPVVLVPEGPIQNKATPIKSVKKPTEEKSVQAEPTPKNMLSK